MKQPSKAADTGDREEAAALCPWPLDSDHGQKWLMGWDARRQRTINHYVAQLRAQFTQQAR